MSERKYYVMEQVVYHRVAVMADNEVAAERAANRWFEDNIGIDEGCCDRADVIDDRDDLPGGCDLVVAVNDGFGYQDIEDWEDEQEAEADGPEA